MFSTAYDNIESQSYTNSAIGYKKHSCGRWTRRGRRSKNRYGRYINRSGARYEMFVDVRDVDSRRGLRTSLRRADKDNADG
ncbi:Gp37-like protein [Paenibacillus larvae]|uniref:Gp37-like protein n=1 Tax=Paenibacillus larvae TaxID=1464 RepID=UPI0037C8D110